MNWIDRTLYVVHSVALIANAAVLAMFMTWCTDTGRWISGEYHDLKPVAMQATNDIGGVKSKLAEMSEWLKSRRGLFGEQQQQ